MQKLWFWLGPNFLLTATRKLGCYSG